MQRALIAALLTGCGFTTPADPRSRLTFDRIAVGSTVISSPEDVSALPASYLEIDPSAPTGMRRLPADHFGPGTWIARSSTEPMPIEFQLPDYPMPLTRVLDFPAREIRNVYVVYEHPDAQPAPSGSTLALAMKLDHPVALGETFTVLTVGEWAAVAITPNIGDTALGQTFPHEKMTSLSGRPHVAFKRDDTELLLRYASTTLTGFAVAAPFEETGADALVGAMTPVTADHLTAIAIDRDAALTRLLGATPAFGNITTSWSISAAPAAQYGQTVGPSLARGSVPAGATALSVPYPDPFADRGWPALLQWVAGGSRTVTTSLLPVTLYAGLYEYRLAGAGGEATLPAGVPQGLTLDGHPLSTDNQVLPLPTRPVEVEFLSDRAETSLTYTVVLYEMIPNSDGTQLSYRFVVALTGLAPHFTIPADVFIADKLYILRAQTVAGGYDPAALANGDLTRRTLPISVGYADGGVFTVR